MSAAELTIDPTEKWLGAVAYSHSGSEATEKNYRRHFNSFLEFIGRSADEIVTEYEKLDDFNDERRFKDKIADQITSWIFALRKSLTDSSVKVMVGAVQSFFKYNRIEIGFIPMARGHVVYHNRDITRKEIADILNTSLVRDRAFYSVVAQSGIRPISLCELKIKNIEYDRMLRGESPVRIEVPLELAKGKYDHYFSFISSEAIQFLSDYLKTRKITNESYLFVKLGTQNEPMKTAAFSAQFNRTVRKLREKGVLDFEVRDNKPSELRLYSLRKFFEKYTYQCGEEFSEFWMGHKGKGVRDNYRARDVEHHRRLYAEKAAPFLRIESKTPNETEKRLQVLQKQLDEKEMMIKELKEQQMKLAPLVDFIDSFDDPETLKKTMEILKGSYIVDSLDEKGSVIGMKFSKEVDEKIEQTAELQGKSASRWIKGAVISQVENDERKYKRKKISKK